MNKIIVTLPNDNTIEFTVPVTALDVAAAISPKLKAVAVAAKVNDELVDLSTAITSNAKINIIKVSDAEGLEILRHSVAHLLAQAVCELFPGAYPTIGPSIEDGFYHDFYYPKGFVEDDLVRIEAKMHELAAADYKIVRTLKKRADAIKFFTERNEKYKVDLIAEIPDAEVSFYKQGSFSNVCRGPHVPSTGFLRAFKLTKLTGAYWRGDAKNEMLPRIYGTAFATEKELKTYLLRLEEAKKRDHRLIGRKLDLFHTQDESPGSIFWHPNGWIIYQELRKYIAGRVKEFGYQEVSTPIILDRSLWETSGHWDKYAETMFVTGSEERLFALRPMNCPGQLQIFKQGLKSYRDLPIRYAEFGNLHRNEHSGTLHGLFRVRGFVQDDGHIFCTEDQIAAEANAYIDQLLSVYSDLGFNNVRIKLSTRPENRVGGDEIWDQTEKALIEILKSKAIDWVLAPGDGAFYGPKIDFNLKDCLGRDWQCGTLQLDASMPMRFNAHYIDAEGNKKTPMMLHRAMLGSLERFIGILLEETAGNLPIWLAPIQVVVANITDNQREYVEKICATLTQTGLRVVSDLRNEKIGFKIREHALQRIPYIIVVGDKEMQGESIAVRDRNGVDLGAMPLTMFIARVQAEILKRNKN